MKPRHTTWFLIILLAASVYLGFKNLDSAWFWDDEAYASTMARNWNRTGELTAWDGPNNNPMVSPCSLLFKFIQLRNNHVVYQDYRELVGICRTNAIIRTNRLFNGS